MARSCCSNWLVTQASNVRWPELCGRGASSLTSRRAVARQEQLDAEHADHVEALQDAAGDLHRLAVRPPAARRPARSRRRGCGGGGVFSITPEVGEARRRAPRAATTETSRSKSTNASSTASWPPIACQAAAASSGDVDLHLPLAVVAQAGRLEHRRDCPARRGAASSSASERTGANGATGKPAPARNVFSRRRCWVVWSTAPAGPHRRVLGGGLGGGGGDVLELEGDDVHPAGELADRVEVVVGGLDFEVGNLAGGRVVVGRERVHAVAHPAGGDGEHAAELAAAQHADGRRRARIADASRSRQGLVPHPAAVCSSAKCGSFSRSSGRVVARIRTASRAALVAPALPMASVPTGTPAGIWTIESSESRPLRAWLWTGTPSTGSRVWAATMPGRWAAPPAPAMITSMPAVLGAVGEFGHPVGRAVGGDDVAFVRERRTG